MWRNQLSVLLAVLSALTWALPELASRKVQSTQDCPGYKASNIKDSGSELTADLTLAGTPCNIYGKDLKDLKLSVQYQTADRLHVKIVDADKQVYQVPVEVVPEPESAGTVKPAKSDLKFEYKKNPFSFSIVRSSTGEKLFDTSDSPLIFENQYLGLRTKLPEEPHLYGLGEHSDPFELKTHNYTRTLWSRDSPRLPAGTNLYGNHPVYIDHRGASGAHGVFLRNSNGMDIKINKTVCTGQYLEYNTLGGVVDLYFFAGPSPTEVSQQYSEVIGLPAMHSYWSLGFHQCRYGYRDVFDVAEVVANYSRAGIPLETMWTDIDYMDMGKVFTLDPARFPLHLMRQLVHYLHQHQQHYVVMVDPAVPYKNASAYADGKQLDVFLKSPKDPNKYYNGVVWPGVAVFPDWFHPKITEYWNGQFESFFSLDSGVDIDALWIDMNEASNFCPFPCANPQKFAEQIEASPATPDPPPVRPDAGRPIPGFPKDFQPGNDNKGRRMADPTPEDGALAEIDARAIPSFEVNPEARATLKTPIGLPNRELLYPPYEIQNAAGTLMTRTIRTDIVHANGLVEYDTHNLYGTMMSEASRDAMLARRPGVRPTIMTRSTFAGAGRKVGHWLGDNESTWHLYRRSIAQLMAFTSIFQVPMTGSDVCGFLGDTTEELCARWAMLGAFSPFYRNHNMFYARSQEFYRWPVVAKAAKKAINARYRMLDYIYTAMYQQTQDGTPLVAPMFFLYPSDTNTFPIDHQYFYGSSLLVSPVTKQGATSVSIYLPKDIFYNFWTGEAVQGQGKFVELANQALTDIPLHVKGGSILPLRVQSANTTTELRKKDFELLVAPGKDGKASGKLYIDDGESISPTSSAVVTFDYSSLDSTVQMRGRFGYDPDVSIKRVTVLGSKGARKIVKEMNVPLTGPTSIKVQGD